MQMSMTEALVLVSFTMVAPAMFIVLAAVFSGSFSRTENARYLPLRHREKDHWETGRPRAAQPPRDRPQDRAERGEAS